MSVRKLAVIKGVSERSIVDRESRRRSTSPIKEIESNLVKQVNEKLNNMGGVSVMMVNSSGPGVFSEQSERSKDSKSKSPPKPMNAFV